ncbi:hypothetical protein [Pseudorhodoferax sp.]|uniref:hypothetical protein n=1 Tax=Pseudorhodoferax sp. TaxID=1993553 RepID=UPI002DD64FFF|nr:hypothetical protein [Pseudorhodoferax sp.]
MQHDIHAQAQRAQAELQQAVARLDAARAAYQDGAGAQVGQALARQADLQRKSATADAEVQAADAAFRAAFEAAGFERTDAVRAAQRRKGDAQDLAEATRAALQRCGTHLGRDMIEASAQGRAYLWAHEKAYAAYARAQAHQAIAEAGAQIARAMALMAHVPLDDSGHEDWQGRPSPSEATAHELKAARSAFILQALTELATARPEYATRPHVEMLGACDLGPLTERELLTPGQVHMARHKLEKLATAP